MAKKKKKMTKAQAAAARRDDGKRKYEPLPDSVLESGPKDSNNRLIAGVTVVIIALVVVLSAVFAFPGMMGQ